MESKEFFIIRVMIFILVSIFLVILSWKPLKNIYSHGFYRFFAFEGILILVLMNFPFWVKNPFSPIQLISWFFLFLSILFVSQGFYFLKKIGGLSDNREMHSENLSFENTTKLVTEGIFKYIRHPMYSSLMLLIWGSFLKFTTVIGFSIALISSVFLFVTAKIEEKENVDFFGLSYEVYIKKTKMFFPFLF